MDRTESGVRTEVRRLSGDEFHAAAYPLMAYAFEPSPPLADQQRFLESAQERKRDFATVLFENGKAVSSAGVSPMRQNVRGKQFPVGGIWGVATSPAARRKGYARRALAAMLAELRGLEQPLVCLYPFRESFYERLGWATWPGARLARLDTENLTPLLRRELGGQVEMIPWSEGYQIYREYTQALGRQVHGFAVFEQASPGSAQRDQRWLAVARAGGETIGVMLYKIEGHEDRGFKLKAGRFYYHASAGRYLLLEWLARHAGLVPKAELRLPPYEHPETWLSDLQAVSETIFVLPMGRVVDIARLGGIPVSNGGPVSGASGRPTAGAGFSAHVSDPLCPWNEGDWRFEASEADGGESVLSVRPAGGAECHLSINALSALVYGTQDPADFAVLGWGNPSPETQAVMRGLFPAATPHMNEIF